MPTGDNDKYEDPEGNDAPYYPSWDEENTRWVGYKIIARTGNTADDIKNFYWDADNTTWKEI